MFQKTTAINKILDCKRNIVGIQGGTSAGKTYGQIPIEIDYAIKHPGTEISIVAESVPHLKRGAMRDFKKIMHETNRWADDGWKATESTYYFTNGSFIEFFSADDSAKLRGARRDRLYMNEANKMKFDAYLQLSSRTKGKVTLDWNPTSSFWFHDELIDDPDVDFLILTYKDNEGCPERAREFILKAKEKAKKSTFWENWYRVYGLGLIGSLEGTVLPNWEFGTFDDTIPSVYGQDYGFSNDPSTLIETAIDKVHKKIYVRAKFYKTKLTTSQIANLNKTYAGKSLIIGDSAEPRLITELKSHGCNLIAVKKGRDSIMTGIAILQDYTIIVDEYGSEELVKELNNYIWKDKGKLMPIDAFNHYIDALRYAVYYQLSNPNRGKYSVY